MNTVLRLLPVLGIWSVVLASPGPDVLATARYATVRSRREGVLVGLGVSSAIGVWAASSMFGLAVLLARLSWLYDLVRLAGAVYLGYLGLRTLLALRRGRGAAEEDGAGAVPDTGGLLRAWRVGFLTNIGNPKAAVFFGSLFSAVLPAHPAVWFEALTLVCMLAMAAAWFTAVACLFSLSAVARGYRRARRAIDALTGCLFLALAGALAAE